MAGAAEKMGGIAPNATPCSPQRRRREAGMSEVTLFNVWRRPPASHASAGDGKTLCGVDCSNSYIFDEGGFITLQDEGDRELMVSCRRCRAAMQKLATTTGGGDGR